MIRKTLFLYAATCIIISGSANAQVLLSQNFDSVSNPGLPSGWSSVPASQWATGAPNTVTPNALNGLNYSLNNAAHTKAVGIDGTQSAADGAIIASPTFSIPASAVNAVLEYDVAYFNIQSNNTPPETESLIFIVSTNGGATWSDISFVGSLSDPSQNVWETRSVPMSSYAGQSNLKFGFRYNNQGGNLIGATFDNFRLVNGTDGAVIAAFAGDHPDPSTGVGYQLSGSNTTLTGTVKNTGSVAINSYYIKYKVGNGAVQTSALISAQLAPLATASFPQGLPVTIPANANYAIKVWMQATGDIDHNNDTMSITTVGVPYLPVKRPVLEEGTGTWCGWCPRGAVFMDAFASGHPGSVAGQIAVHNNDPMMVNSYDSFMHQYAGGFPNLVIDRTIERDPRDIDTAFGVAKNNFGFADFTIGTPVMNGNIVSVPVTIKPVVAITNPKLSLVVTESNVKGGGSDDWMQNNYYSGGGSGTMGGWENEESHVPGVYFHFVARSATPSVGGGAAGLPSTLNAGTTYNATLTATLNSSWKVNNLQYIAFLINGSNASIMNSASTALPSLSPSLGNNTALANVDDGVGQAVLYPNPASDETYITFNVKDGGKAVMTMYDIMGKKVFDTVQQIHPGNNTVQLKTNGLVAGNYIVRLTTDKATITRKLQVVK